MRPIAKLSSAASTAALVMAAALGCAGIGDTESVPPLARSKAAEPGVPPPEPTCSNESLTAYDGLLVLAPHPDDETLAFAGLIRAYLDRQKPVQVVVSTDGDAYCEACRFWKSGSLHGPMCRAEDFSDFATEAVDSFAEVRRSESVEAMNVLGVGGPTFLGYPDTGLAAAWANFEEGSPSRLLRRSDFSGCEDCETCAGGYGEGPPTELSASTLMETLRARISGVSENTLIATTHFLDGHGDHAALGRFVRLINGRLDRPRTIAFAVIHAHTPKDAAHPDCWYPGPRALQCPCADQERAIADPDFVADLRAHRLRPDWPAALPDDAAYGDEVHLCLPGEMYRGATATKLEAVEVYESQLGFASRSGDLPDGLGGIIDCSGYLISFVRRTEVFVLSAPGRNGPG